MVTLAQCHACAVRRCCGAYTQLSVSLVGTLTTTTGTQTSKDVSIRTARPPAALDRVQYTVSFSGLQAAKSRFTASATTI